MRRALLRAGIAALLVGATTLAAQTPAAQTPAPQNAPAPAAPPPVDLAPRLTQLADRVASIDAQALRIDDYNQLRNLQAIFGFYHDEALWDQVADLFADDATLEIGQNGVYAGKASIRRYFLGLTGGRTGLQRGDLSIQGQLSPVITLAADGLTARARWRVQIQDAVYGKEANWGSGVYENEYVKQDGVWKIRRLQLFLRFYAPYEGGWTHATAALNARYGRSTARADRPPTTRYDSWPARFTPPMHYGGASEAYRLAPENSARAAAPAANAPRTAAQLEAMVRALELKVDRLRAVDEVENLQSAYGYYADMSMQDATSALFTENSTLEILGRGIFLGRDRIYEYMRRLGAPTEGRLFTHMQLQPVITVAADGTRANIRARLFELFGVYPTQAQWAEGTYENRFVLDGGQWKYQGLNGYQTFYTPYDPGWGKQSNPLMNYFPGYPPDQPHSIEYEPYPAVFVPPFHYRNPVSGR
ncbi:MAG: nuclear transport factor 2 family protein [Steroidobacteraceae bacterium]